MVRKVGATLVIAVLVTALILAAAPLFAKNPLSEQIWQHDKASGRRPPPPPGPDEEEPPSQHDWNPQEHFDGEEPSEDAEKYEHPGVPVGVFPEQEVRYRYEGAEVWRGEDEIIPVDQHMVPQRGPRERPVAKPVDKFKNKAEYMEQQIVADLPDHPLAEETFLMIKTGSQTQWNRMPWHLYATIPRVKHFGLYSDLPGSIAGYEIVDVLKDLPEEVMKEEAFSRYRLAHQMSEEHWSWEGAELNADGGWELDKYKNIPMLLHAYKTKPDAKWYFFIDDDTFVFWDNLYHLLDQYNSTEPYYLGSPASKAPPYPFAHGGSGVVLSQGTMALLFDHSDDEIAEMLEKYARRAVKVCCGDYVVAEAVGERGVVLNHLGYDEYQQEGGPFHGGAMWNYILRPGMFGTRLITLHHIDHYQAEVLYEYEKLRRSEPEPFTTAKYYRDFILPYITKERKNWRMPRRDKTYEPKRPGPKDNQDPEHESNAPLRDNGAPLFPYRSKDFCRRACELEESCVQWTQSPGLCELATRGFTMGRASNLHQTGFKKEEKGPFYTGWMVNRIRLKRSLCEDDPLEYDPETKTWNDDDSTSEGWYLRKLGGDHYTPFDGEVTTF